MIWGGSRPPWLPSGCLHRDTMPLSARGLTPPYSRHGPELARCLRCYGNTVSVICPDAPDLWQSATARNRPDVVAPNRRPAECPLYGTLNICPVRSLWEQPQYGLTLWQQRGMSY